MTVEYSRFSRLFPIFPDKFRFADHSRFFRFPDEVATLIECANGIATFAVFLGYCFGYFPIRTRLFWNIRRTRGRVDIICVRRTINIFVWYNKRQDNGQILLKKQNVSFENTHQAPCVCPFRRRSNILFYSHGSHKFFICFFSL